MRIVGAATAVALALPLLAACGNASTNDPVKSSGAPIAAPEAFGTVDLDGVTLQRDTKLSSGANLDFQPNPSSDQSFLG